MGKSYSSDLRERVMGFVDAGHSRRKAACHFGVSPSFAVKLALRRQKTGSHAPAKQGRPRGGGKLASHCGFLIARVEHRPDITMPELAAALEAERGVKASPASLSRVLCQAGFTYKKNASGIGARTRRCQARASVLDIAPPTANAD
jgi:transposase